MRRSLIISMIVLAALLVLFCAYLLLISRPLQEKSVEAQVRVGNYAGINLDNDKLYFGTVPPGGKAARDVVVASDKPRYVIVRTQGEITGWLWADEPGFMALPGIKQSVNIRLAVPSEASMGNHTGEIIMDFYRPAARFLLRP